MHTIFCERRYLSNLISNRTPLKTILDLSNLIEGHEQPVSYHQMVLNLPLKMLYSHPVPEKCYWVLRIFTKTITMLNHWRKWNGVSLHNLLFIQPEVYFGKNGMPIEWTVYYNHSHDWGYVTRQKLVDRALICYDMTVWDTQVEIRCVVSSNHHTCIPFLLRTLRIATQFVKYARWKNW